jgi:hypothetical protein
MPARRYSQTSSISVSSVAGHLTISASLPRSSDGATQLPLQFSNSRGGKRTGCGISSSYSRNSVLYLAHWSMPLIILTNTTIKNEQKHSPGIFVNSMVSLADSNDFPFRNLATTI